MEFISNLILKWLGGGWLKKVLDLIPLNGKKTLLCGLATALAVLLTAYDQGALKVFMDLVVQSGGEVGMSPEQIAMVVTAMATLISIFHKFLKWLETKRG
jgi:hypothetical protein